MVTTHTFREVICGCVLLPLIRSAPGPGGLHYHMVALPEDHTCLFQGSQEQMERAVTKHAALRSSRHANDSIVSVVALDTL